MTDIVPSEYILNFYFSFEFQIFENIFHSRPLGKEGGEGGREKERERNGWLNDCYGETLFEMGGRGESEFEKELESGTRWHTKNKAKSAEKQQPKYKTTHCFCRMGRMIYDWNAANVGILQPSDGIWNGVTWWVFSNRVRAEQVGCVSHSLHISLGRRKIASIGCWFSRLYTTDMYQ